MKADIQVSPFAQICMVCSCWRLAGDSRINWLKVPGNNHQTICHHNCSTWYIIECIPMRSSEHDRVEHWHDIFLFEFLVILAQFQGNVHFWQKFQLGQNWSTFSALAFPQYINSITPHFEIGLQLRKFCPDIYLKFHKLIKAILVPLRIARHSGAFTP